MLTTQVWPQALNSLWCARITREHSRVGSTLGKVRHGGKSLEPPPRSRAGRLGGRGTCGACQAKSREAPAERPAPQDRCILASRSAACSGFWLSAQEPGAIGRGSRTFMNAWEQQPRFAGESPEVVGLQGRFGYTGLHRREKGSDCVSARLPSGPKATPRRLRWGLRQTLARTCRLPSTFPRLELTSCIRNSPPCDGRIRILIGVSSCERA